MRAMSLSQKAPSAKRCIKTAEILDPAPLPEVRKHRAPKGALRPAFHELDDDTHGLGVRKHRAPKGALRRRKSPAYMAFRATGQKAPSAKRCIKTVGS